MKFSICVLALVMAIAIGIPAAFAQEGGMPAAHGLSGAEFGAAVSDLATSEPGAVADHVSGCGKGNR
jgi:hypothetical protein